MLLNGIVNVVDIEVELIEGDQKHIEVGLICGIPMPVGPGQVMALPAAKLRFLLSERTSAENVADEIKKLAADLPKASGLEVASNVNEVEAAAERLERIRQGGPARQD